MSKGMTQKPLNSQNTQKKRGAFNRSTRWVERTTEVTENCS
jgi:hypothetical protein